MNRERLLKTFLQLVQIDSESGHERAVADYLVTRLDNLGMSYEIDDVGKVIGSDTGNIISRMEGDLPGSIALSAHMDTVVPGNGVKPIIENGIIKSDGTTILGADDKSGIAVILETLEYYKDKPHPTIEAVLDVQEELGLRGASHMQMDKVKSDFTVVLDTNGRNPKQLIKGYIMLTIIIIALVSLTLWTFVEWGTVSPKLLVRESATLVGSVVGATPEVVRTTVKAVKAANLATELELKEAGEEGPAAERPGGA